MSTLLQKQLEIEELNIDGYERVVRFIHKEAGLDAVISVHDLTMGPALGGTRIHPYASFDQMLTDVLRLSKGMTHKSTATLSGWGGGKSVINADPKTQKTPQLLEAFAQAVNFFKGGYICAEDVGCTPDDAQIISQTTPYVVGLPNAKSSGNPSLYTAWGVFRGIEAVAKQLGFKNLQGLKVAVQGTGSVGKRLCELLFWHGVDLIVTDINLDVAKEVVIQFGAQLVDPEEIYQQSCDIFSPCAMGGILHDRIIPKLRCKAIAGAANNQLLSDADARHLNQLGILYAPDFVINAGGLINVTVETTKEGYNPTIARKKVDEIYDQLELIFQIAKKNKISTQQAVMQLIEYRLKHSVGKRKETVYMHHAGISF